jgi:serine/threonine protein kinase
VHCLLEAAKALQELHTVGGLIHGDLKGGNILYKKHKRTVDGDSSRGSSSAASCLVKVRDTEGAVQLRGEHS